MKKILGLLFMFSVYVNINAVTLLDISPNNTSFNEDGQGNIQIQSNNMPQMTESSFSGGGSGGDQATTPINFIVPFLILTAIPLVFYTVKKNKNETV